MMKRGNDYEKEMVVDRAGSNHRDSAFYLHRWRGGDASVELAATAAVRMANADVLAGARLAGFVSGSLRRTGRPRRSRRSGSEAPLGPPLQEDDSRRAGEVQAGDG